ncbi:MAG: MBL fold metallo-hydrolase, partial [Gammaproteobacteria bacterium]|nr:MBL fold metallo-hydrolase [Gammaproteobacteria bacterium]NIV21485.1 MBL fold metallo-hydrolase [Gammaproteobacteria bacterium]NIY33136.1 MBL fold metallo-hydrolase [Gammaproteobacteria bacterium]
MNWEHVDVILDSPLAASFTRYYKQMRELWDAEARRRLDAGRHPLDFEQLTTIDRHEDHLRMVEHL